MNKSLMGTKLQFKHEYFWNMLEKYQRWEVFFFKLSYTDKGNPFVDLRGISFWNNSTRDIIFGATLFLLKLCACLTPTIRLAPAVFWLCLNLSCTCNIPNCDTLKLTIAETSLTNSVLHTSRLRSPKRLFDSAETSNVQHFRTFEILWRNWKKTPDLTFEVLKNFTKDFFKVKFRIPHASLTRRAVPSLNLPPTRLIYLTKSRRQV